MPEERVTYGNFSYPGVWFPVSQVDGDDPIYAICARVAVGEMTARDAARQLRELMRRGELEFLGGFVEGEDGVPPPVDLPARAQ